MKVNVKNPANTGLRVSYCNLACSIDLKTLISGMDDFKNINESTLEGILNISHIKEFSKDTILHYANEKCNNVMYLFHGVVKIYKINKYDNEVIINLYINECANKSNPLLMNYEMLYQDTINNNFVCLQECKILYIDSNGLRSLIESDYVLQSNMLQVANRIIREQESIIDMNLAMDSKAKILSLLQKNPNIFTTINKKTIAQILNISQETLSRILKQINEEGIRVEQA